MITLDPEREQLRMQLLTERAMSTEEYLAHAESQLPHPVSEGFNMAEICCDQWAIQRNRLAIIMYEEDGHSRRWTYFDLMQASKSLAAFLVESGLKPGDRFAALLDQQVEAYICSLAAWRAGLVYVPLFSAFGVDAIAERLNNADVSALVVDHANRAHYENVAPLLEHTPLILTVGGEQGRGVRAGDHSLWDEIDSHAPEFATTPTSPRDPAVLIYTSGTTGKPKGCLLPHIAVMAVRSFVRHVMAPTSTDLFFNGANPGWGFGLTTAGHAPLSLGVPVVMRHGHFDPTACVQIINSEHVTYTAFAPSAYRPLTAAARRLGLPSSMRGGVSAGEPCDAALAHQWELLGGGPLQDGYGATELGMLIGDLAYDENPSPAGAMSGIVPGYEVGLRTDAGDLITDLNCESEGEIAVGNNRWGALGYRGREEAWLAKHHGDFIMSGDRARRDENGHWWFISRNDDLIVTSGLNVGPTEVEGIILSIPGVREVAVVAAPDKAKGSIVRAVVIADGTVPRSAIEEAIEVKVRLHLGRHAAPRIVDFLDEFPRTETGKIRRNVLRSQSSLS